MSDIEEGAPTKGRRGSRSELGNKLLELAEIAFRDKGKWYSIPNPTGRETRSLTTPIIAKMGIVAGESSTKNGRIWMRFYGDDE